MTRNAGFGHIVVNTEPIELTGSVCETTSPRAQKKGETRSHP